jgi:hypothetical protein
MRKCGEVRLVSLTGGYAGAYPCSVLGQFTPIRENWVPVLRFVSASVKFAYLHDLIWMLIRTV